MVVATILGSLFWVWLFGNVLRRLGMRVVFAPWGGYALTMILGVVISYNNGVSWDGLILYGCFGLGSALWLSLRWMPSTRRSATSPDDDDEEQNALPSKKSRKARSSASKRKDFTCFDCGAAVHFGASHCGECGAEFRYSGGAATRAE